MAKQCEMKVLEFFHLSGGQIAFVGEIVPDINQFITQATADLYIENEKIKTIKIIGEDRFSGGDEEKRKGKRAIRTDDDIMSVLKLSSGKEIKLIIQLSD